MDTRKRTTELALDLISPPLEVKLEVMSLLEASEKWFKHEGLQGIKRSKQYFDIALNVLLGQPYDRPAWIKLDKSTSYPSLIKRTLLWGEEFPKEALTLLRIHELFVNNPTDEDCLKAMESIKAPSTATNHPEYIQAILDEAENFTVEKLKVSPGPVPMFTNGPNGISILSGPSDSKAHRHYGTSEKMLNFLDDVASHGTGMRTSGYMKDMLQADFGNYSDESLGRLVFLSEKSGKLRVIATGDYFTQTAMKPIHDTINSILMKIQGDYTFDQEAGKSWAQKSTGTSKWMSSYDMSAATDRLPAWLQSKIIDIVLPGQLGDQWLDLITNRDFTYKLPSGKQGSINYAVGQPMGFYSSFASFALLHHLVVRAAYRLAHEGRNLPKRQFYAIIGDDMCITDKKAGEMYVKIITSIGGVVNLEKSRLSKTPGVTICEFAKAWFINGKDITPSSLRALRSSLKQGWTSVPAAIGNFEQKLDKRLKVKKMKKILQKYWPNETNTLMRLIPVPQLMGGFGKPDSNPLVATVKGTNGNAIRTFIANKVYSVFKMISSVSDEDIDEALSGIIDKDLQRLALEPILTLLKETEKQVNLPNVVTSRKSFIRWATDEGTSLSTLIDWFDKMKLNLPVKMREQLDQPSLSWIRALEDDKKLSTSSDADISLHYAALELMDDNKSRS
jgi:hypothetical protein